jgi:hypothetical protein
MKFCASSISIAQNAICCLDIPSVSYVYWPVTYAEGCAITVHNMWLSSDLAVMSTLVFCALSFWANCSTEKIQV